MRARESSQKGVGLPANASRAFLMSSFFRMLLIAIFAVEETRKEEKDRWDKVKNKLARERWWNSGTFLYYSGDTPEMEQESRMRVKEVTSDRVNEWERRAGRRRGWTRGGRGQTGRMVLIGDGRNSRVYAKCIRETEKNKVGQEGTGSRRNSVSLSARPVLDSVIWLSCYRWTGQMLSKWPRLQGFDKPSRSWKTTGEFSLSARIR